MVVANGQGSDRIAMRFVSFWTGRLLAARKHRLAALAAGLWLAAAQAAPAYDESAAVVLMYHRFGEDAYPSTSVTIEQFESHLEMLGGGAYTVLPLDEVVAALATGRPLPDRTVAITVDDTSRTVLTQGQPRLKAAGFPFTVFVNTDSVGRSGSSLTWDEVRQLHAAGVAIGAHSAAHDHMAFMDTALVKEDLARMTDDFLRELGFVPRLFAYPYGEFSAELVAAVKDAGFVAAFGQYSGVAEAGQDLHALPRFALNERYGTPERFATVIETRPFPVGDVLPTDPLVGDAARNPPAVGFTALDAAGPLERLACYASNGADVTLKLLGRRAELRLDRPFAPGRSRINCTLPLGDGRFRWLGLPFLVAGGS